MKHKTMLVFIIIAIFAAIPAQAQFGNIKKAVTDKTKAGNTQSRSDTEKSEKKNEPVNKTPANYSSDPDFLFVGADGLDGDSISEMRVCSLNYSGANPLKDRFKLWIDKIDSTAQEKLFAGKKCDLMGFPIEDNPAYKYRNADSLETLAQGNSAYRVEGSKLRLVKDFAAPSFYVVVVPDVNKPGLTLKELNLGVTPDLKDTYRRKTRSVYNYHDLKQALYIFEKYKNYPSPLETNSVLFNANDFASLNKQGSFKGLVIYRLIGDALEPVK